MRQIITGILAGVILTAGLAVAEPYSTGPGHVYGWIGEGEVDAYRGSPDAACTDALRPGVRVTASVDGLADGDLVRVTVHYADGDRALLLSGSAPSGTVTGEAPDGCMPHVTVEGVSLAARAEYRVSEGEGVDHLVPSHVCPPQPLALPCAHVPHPLTAPTGPSED